MPAVFEKLNLKDQQQIVVLNAPDSFEREIATLRNVVVLRDLQTAREIGFSLAFVTRQKEVDTLAKSVGRKAAGDAVVWFAYPKSSSKNYKCEFNRDNRWQALGEAGFEPVRMVAIDDDWSAVRFRRVEFIKTMTRPSDVRLTDKAKTSKRAVRR